jgi:hypothetical protein
MRLSRLRSSASLTRISCFNRLIPCSSPASNRFASLARASARYWATTARSSASIPRKYAACRESAALADVSLTKTLERLTEINVSHTVLLCDSIARGCHLARLARDAMADLGDRHRGLLGNLAEHVGDAGVCACRRDDHYSVRSTTVAPDAFFCTEATPFLALAFDSYASPDSDDLAHLWRQGCMRHR